MSSGTSERRSMTSASMPCSAAQRSAASSALRHHRRQRDDRDVGALAHDRAPARAVSTCSPSGTSPLSAKSALCSQKITGSGSRTAAAIRPDDVGRRRRRDDLQARDGHRPVLDALAVLRAEAEAGAVGGPQHERQRDLAVGHVARLGDLVGDHVPGHGEEVRNISSAIGRRPVIAAPIAAPTMACSLIGVSRTRSGRTVEQALGQLEHAAGRPDVLADQDDRSGRAPSPGRCRPRSPPR